MVLLTREQLEDRLAALHRASLELVSDLSVETLLERIVQLAREQVGAHYAALGVANEDGSLARFITAGMSPEDMKRMSHPPTGRGLLGLFKKEASSIRIPEISADPRSVGFPRHHPIMHSFLGVPIIANRFGGEILGQLYLTDKQDYPEFTEQDERVIETLAAYAAVAITNARLYEAILARDAELVQRNEDLALINNLAASLMGSIQPSSPLDLDDILEKTLNQVIAYLDVEAGEIFLREDNERELHLALHRGDFSDPFANRESFTVGEGYVGMVARTGKTMVSQDPHQEMHYLRPAVLEAGFQTIICIPLTAHGLVVGVMSAATRAKRTFDERELALLNAIGAWAGITIENVRLNRQARRLAVLEERERIGMDLHDGIIQSIYGVGLALDYARIAIEEAHGASVPQLATHKIEQSIETLNKTIRDIRAYILDLRPRQFHGEDLRQGLLRLVEEFNAVAGATNAGAHATLTAPESGLVDFPFANATALFHICQEALANIAKHSKARHAAVQLWTASDRVLLEITDDGAGFDLSKMSVTLGHGLSNMHVRARKVGGDVEITSFPGEGATVLAWVPRRAPAGSTLLSE